MHEHTPPRAREQRLFVQGGSILRSSLAKISNAADEEFLVLGPRGSVPPPKAPHYKRQNSCGNPNPKKFTAQHSQTSRAKKSPHSDWGHSDRPPRKKVSLVIERRKESDAETTIRHGIQKTMAGDRQKEVCPELDWAEALRAAPKSANYDGRRDKTGEEQRVRKSPVPPKVGVPNSETESNDV